jgi:hypothetical protein
MGSAAHDLHVRGHCLFLFQTFGADELVTIDPGAYASMSAHNAPPVEAMPYAPGVLQLVHDQFHGQISRCATFIVVYSP